MVTAIAPLGKVTAHLWKYIEGFIFVLKMLKLKMCTFAWTHIS